MKRFLVSLLLLTGCGSQDASQTTSITDDNYNGKKYYFGWGAAASGDPSMMHNEVKYDVQHTHDIFTKDIGGDYIGAQVTGSGNVNSSVIKQKWSEITDQMTWNDMYLQYSSGHGSRSGLGVGVSYTDMRDAVLQMPGKELIVFTMACNSGGLVNSFNSKKSEWEPAFRAAGRTLFVMSSSTVDENSSTGPGRDPDEPNGPNGSAGSAFGHALWKALIGYADKEKGNNDKKTTLQELIDYTLDKTERIGGHTPVFTGIYDPNLVIALVPSQEVIDAMEAEGGTGGMTEEQVRELLSK